MCILLLSNGVRKICTAVGFFQSRCKDALTITLNYKKSKPSLGKVMVIVKLVDSESYLLSFLFMNKYNLTALGLELEVDAAEVG